MRDKITDTVDTARPYVERLARDEELHDHVKKDSARKIYDELIGPSGPSGMAFKVAKDKDLQDELKKAVAEFPQGRRPRSGQDRARGAEHDTAPHGHRPRRPLQPSDRPGYAQMAP